jgi:hypothetical protein
MAKATGARTPKKATRSETPQAETARTERATPASSKSLSAVSKDNGGARPSQEELQEAIRHRAYQLYCERGQQGGNPEEDWSRAEREIMARYGRSA